MKIEQALITTPLSLPKENTNGCSHNGKGPEPFTGSRMRCRKDAQQGAACGWIGLCSRQSLRIRPDHQWPWRTILPWYNACLSLCLRKADENGLDLILGAEGEELAAFFERMYERSGREDVVVVAVLRKKSCVGANKE